MKPYDWKSGQVSGIENAKEAVCDAILNLVLERSAGIGKRGTFVFGKKPHRHFVSGFLLPKFDASGDGDETSDIHLNVHGLDFRVDANVDEEITIYPNFSIYVRVLPSWEELQSSRYGLRPIPQPKSELVWKIKQEKFSVFREWRDSDEGKAADYK
ncbi:MAG: hypothetical protein OQK24_12765, partial [Magnetovibrio sp.]|nr:hypothetical protein [Magnetovibrio sp.]